MTATPPKWFATSLESLRTGDLDGWMEIYEDDAVHEFPFAPAWMPQRLEGMAAIASYMATLPSTVRLEAWTIQQVREVDNELIIDGYVDGTRTASGSPFHMEFVWFVTHDEGRVSRFRDYMNPLRFTDDDAQAAAGEASPV